VGTNAAVPPRQDDEDDDLTLSSEEIKTLKLMASYWSGIRTVSQITAKLGSLGKLLMYLYAIYIAIKLGVLDRFLVGDK
jgi:hypothetical protein